MKSLIISLALMAFGGLLLLAPAANAAYNPLPDQNVCNQAKDSAVCQDKPETNNPLTRSDGLILKVTRLIAVVAGIVAVIMMIVGGFQFVFSGGESEKTAAARKTILYALIGLVVIVLAEAIITFVVNLI